MTVPTGTIPQLASYLVSGYWAYNGEIAHHWGTATVTYNIDGLNAAEQLLAQSALAAWHDVANISFTQVHTAAQITYTHAGSMQAYTSDSYNGAGIMSSATINISSNWITNDGGAYDGKTGIDSYGYQTYLHETGHALGLGHQGAYNGSATYGVNNVYANDTWQYSIMSYFNESNYGGSSYRYVVTPQMADIDAMASIYGASTTTRTGDTTYGFHANAGTVYDFSSYTAAPALTIFDSAGNDTLDCSGYAQNQTIDLQAGAFCSVGGLIHNIGIATSAAIENAVGGSGNDSITANDLNNVIHGGAGNDIVYGMGGADTIYGDGGNDYIDGGTGVDIAGFDGVRSSFQIVSMANGGYDIVDMRAGSPDGTDLLFNVEWLMFSDGLFTLNGNLAGTSGGTTFYATIYGGTITGTTGSDTVSYENFAAGVIVNLGAGLASHGTVDMLSSIENVIGTSFGDSIFGNTGNNVLDGGAGGADRFYGGGGIDTVSFAHSTVGVIANLSTHSSWNGGVGEIWNVANLTGSAFGDALFGDAANNVLDGGSGGGDRLYGNGGTDTASFEHAAAGVIVNLNAHATWNGNVGEVWGITNVIGSAGNDSIFGDTADNILDGGPGGGDKFYGGGGNDTVSFDHSTTSVIVTLAGHATWNGQAGEVWGIQNVKGSAFNDTIFGDAGNNTIDGGAGIDRLFGGGGNDTFEFHRGEASGDSIEDFSGSSAGTADHLHFVGFGLAADGATFTQVDATHWSVNSADGLLHETITLANAATVHPADYFFT